ncbi:hypothetical protein [Larkinella ripae]
MIPPLNRWKLGGFVVSLPLDFQGLRSELRAWNYRTEEGKCRTKSPADQ